MNVFERFQGIIEGRHDYAREWKARTGGQVFGYMCIYVPQELIYAAGILPVRILGTREPQDITESHIHGMYCPFCRDVLAQGLQGKYDYLDGIIMSHTCLHMHQAFGIWQLYRPLPYNYYLYMPYPSSYGCDTFLASEFKDFKESLEEYKGSPISPESLRSAMEIYHHNRNLLRRIYELRKKEKPPITGTETMQMMLAGLCMDKKEYNLLLQELYQDISRRNDKAGQGLRLMLTGSENDDIDFVKLVENLGGNIVIDDLCTGSKSFWNNTSLEGDPLVDLANCYMNIPACSPKDVGERPGLKHTMNLAREFKVHGVIQAIQKFCDTYQFDFPAFESTFKEANIPILPLEFDVTLPIGQIKNRVEAFLEMLKISLEL